MAIPHLLFQMSSQAAAAPPIPPPPVTPASLDDSLTGAHGPIVLRFRFEVRTFLNEFLRDITNLVIDATLSGEEYRASYRTFSATTFKLPGFDRKSEAIATFCDVLDHGAFVPTQTGLFLIGNPHATKGENGAEVWAIEGSDLSEILSRTLLAEPFTVTNSDTYNDLIVALVTTAGLRYDAPGISGASGGDVVVEFTRTWPPGTPYREIIDSLLDMAAYHPIYATPEGVMSSWPQHGNFGDQSFTVHGRTPDRVIGVDTKRFILAPGIVDVSDPGGYGNIIRAVWNNTETFDLANGYAVQISATNTDNRSLIGIPDLGLGDGLSIPTTPILIEIPLFTGAVDASSIFNTQYKRDIIRVLWRLAAESAQAMQYQFATYGDPRFDIGDVFQITGDPRFAGRYWSLSWNWHLQPNEPVTHTVGLLLNDHKFFYAALSTDALTSSDVEGGGDGGTGISFPGGLGGSP